MKPTELGYGVQTSHLFPLVNHLGILHFSPSFSTLKIGLMADGELKNISVPNNKKTKFGL